MRPIRATKLVTFSSVYGRVISAPEIPLTVTVLDRFVSVRKIGTAVRDSLVTTLIFIEPANVRPRTAQLRGK